MKKSLQSASSAGALVRVLGGTELDQADRCESGPQIVQD